MCSLCRTAAPVCAASTWASARAARAGNGEAASPQGDQPAERRDMARIEHDNLARRPYAAIAASTSHDREGSHAATARAARTTERAATSTDRCLSAARCLRRLRQRGSGRSREVEQGHDGKRAGARAHFELRRQIDHARERRQSEFACGRHPPEENARGNRDGLSIAPGPGARIQPCAGEVRRK